MLSFIGGLVILIIGYFTYGKFVSGVFGEDPRRAVPSATEADGVDYVEIGWKRAFLIQLLNIAGLGPIYGAVMGALFGPAAFLWIILGAIFAGAVHDYIAGLLSVRNGGETVSELVGDYLGEFARKFMRGFSVILLVLVGTVFMTGPAELLANMTGLGLNTWLVIILAYYFLATILPVDKIIGKFYPVLGASLLIMAVGVGGGLIVGGYDIPNIAFTNLHPDSSLTLWPFLFVTIACGAISGFHATQSPLMARCVADENDGRKVFFGAMIAEGIIAMIWAAAAMTFFGGTVGLSEAINTLGGAGGVVEEVSSSMLGVVGGILAMLGVIALPISSGDTAFRSARLILADIFEWDQGPKGNRFKLAIPLFAVGAILSQLDFGVIWRYFAWSNQTLAMIVLWAGAAYLLKNDRLHWIATLPATFMTAVSVSYILAAEEGFSLGVGIATPVGIVAALLALTLFLMKDWQPEADIEGEVAVENPK